VQETLTIQPQQWQDGSCTWKSNKMNACPLENNEIKILNVANKTAAKYPEYIIPTWHKQTTPLQVGCSVIQMP